MEAAPLTTLWSNVELEYGGVCIRILASMNTDAFVNGFNQVDVGKHCEIAR